MREIKFRAFQPDINEMYPIKNLLSYGYKGDIWVNESKQQPLNTKYGWTNNGDVILMQSTGLLDKNGVEIYEGDIVEILESGVDSKWITIEEVRFDYKYLGFAPFCYIEFVRTNNSVKVIGNIYENSELLNG